MNLGQVTMNENQTIQSWCFMGVSRCFQHFPEFWAPIFFSPRVWEIACLGICRFKICQGTNRAWTSSSHHHTITPSASPAATLHQLLLQFGSPSHHLETMSKLSLVKKKTYCEYMSETWRQTLLGQNPSFFGISNHQHQIRNLYSINLWHVRFWHHLWYVWNCKYWGSQPSYEMVTLAGPRLQLWQSKGRNLGTPSAHLRGRSGKILGNPCEKYAFVIGHHYPIWIHMFAHGWTWFNMV